MENWLAIIISVYLLLMVLYGHYRGFIKLVVSVVALVVSMVIVKAAMPGVTSFLAQKTPIYDVVESGIIQNGGISDLLNQNLDIPASQRSMIEGLKIPQQLKDVLIENNNNEVYDLLGVTRFTDYIVTYIGTIIVNSIGFVVLFIITYGLLKIIIGWIDIVSRLPILSGINKIAGALLGGIEGLIFVWLFFLIATALTGTTFGAIIMEQIEGSAWLTFLHNYNFLTALVMKVVSVIL